MQTKQVGNIKDIEKINKENEISNLGSSHEKIVEILIKRGNELLKQP